jgi:hypothetical protein
MRKFTIESRTIKRESLEVEAASVKEALKIARETDGPAWEEFEQGERELISIS